jgi:hypothetical integral membrane protein (TIGR02206 family)
VTEFHPFSATHAATVAIVLAIVAGLIGWARTADGCELVRGGKLLSGILLLYYPFDCALQWRSGLVSHARALPLDLCSALYFVGAYALWKRNRIALELLFLWTFAGTLHALITPTPGEGFPSVEYVRYFIAHGLLVASAAYARVAFELELDWRSALRAMAGLQVLALAAGMADWLLGENFLYLHAAPPSPTLFDWLGTWPYYLVSLELAAAISIYGWCLASSRIFKGALGRKVAPGSGCTD